MNKLKTFNRPQVIALYQLAMMHGPASDFQVLTAYTVGSLLIEARSNIVVNDVEEPAKQYTLPIEGGYVEVPIRREPGGVQD